MDVSEHACDNDFHSFRLAAPTVDDDGQPLDAEVRRALPVTALETLEKSVIATDHFAPGEAPDHAADPAGRCRAACGS